nr:ATP-dependent DNA helicase PIF1-like [Hydra vulgaris]
METSAHEVLVFKWFDRGYNFFITGGAGCGKSYMLNKLATSEQLYKKIEITASTGTAAHLIGGMTLHSFAGIGVGRNKCEFYLKHMKPEVRERWLNTDVLIIDEISMINAKTFDLLHDLACKIRFENEELFGGIQLIVCGDMLQLKPVEGDYIFKSEIWKKYMQRSVVLTKCFRQKEDPLFFNALNEIRLGKVSDASIEYLTKRHFTNDQLIDKSYPRLFFLRGNVFKYNEFKMSELKGKATCFKAKDKILDNSITVNSFQIPTEVTVKLGAVVMLLKNINVEQKMIEKYSQAQIKQWFLFENDLVNWEHLAMALHLSEEEKNKIRNCATSNVCENCFHATRTLKTLNLYFEKNNRDIFMDIFWFVHCLEKKEIV